MATTMHEPWQLYTERSGDDRWVRFDQLCQHPTVTALRAWPVAHIRATAPKIMRRCLPPLEDQLRDWLRNLKGADSTNLTIHRPRSTRSNWREQHSLAYWNRSGPNGGLRRWG